MTCGIYRIFNSFTKKSYIGSSIAIEHRWKEHISTLRRGVHRNKHLQNSYNKYGIESFSFSIVEETTKDILLEREKYWIDFYKSNHSDTGYNIYKDPTKPGYEKGKVPKTIRDTYGLDRIVSFVSPDGTVYEGIKNVTRFSIEHNLQPVAMNLVATNKRGTHRGWTKLSTKLDLSLSGSRKRRPGKFNINLVNNSGEVFHITNLQQFCEEHNLHYTAIHNLICGLCKKSFGFTLLN